MSTTRKTDRKRCEHFVSSEKGITLHRAAGKKPIAGLPKQTTRPVTRRGGKKLGLGTLRRERHLTQVELARNIGIGQDEVSRIENRKDPRISTILKYLKGLEADHVQLAVTYPDGKKATLPLED